MRKYDHEIAEKCKDIIQSNFPGANPPITVSVYADVEIAKSEHFTLEYLGDSECFIISCWYDEDEDFSVAIYRNDLQQIAKQIKSLDDYKRLLRSGGLITKQERDKARSLGITEYDEIIEGKELYDMLRDEKNPAAILSINY